MRSKRLQWTVGFLTVTATAIAMELFAVLDGQSATQPWTDLLVGFLPAGVGIPVVLGFSAWLCVHFISRWLHHPVAVKYTETDMDNAKEQYFKSGWDAGLKQRDEEQVSYPRHD